MLCVSYTYLSRAVYLSIVHVKGSDVEMQGGSPDVFVWGCVGVCASQYAARWALFVVGSGVCGIFVDINTLKHRHCRHSPRL